MREVTNAEDSAAALKVDLKMSLVPRPTRGKARAWIPLTRRAAERENSALTSSKPASFLSGGRGSPCN